MPVRTPATTIAATATLIEDGTSGTDGAPVSVIIFVPTGGQTVYLGGDDVTAATGLPIAAGTFSPGFDLFGGDKLYGIVAATTQLINVLKTRA